jgi:chemotaxis protein MotA
MEVILGLFLGIGAILYVMARGEILRMIFNVDAALIVFAGTLGATIITYPMRFLMEAIQATRANIFKKRKYIPENVIDMVTNLSEKAKRDGIASMQMDLADMDDKFLKDGIQMIIDGLDPDLIRENLEKEIIFTRRRHQQIANIFRTMGTYAPVFGLLGTLIGVVQVLRNLGDAKSLGVSMSIAITTTFYGIFGANFLFLPIAGKLSTHSEEELLIKEVMIEGIISIQEGDIPIIVRRKLQAFFAVKVRK